MIPKRRLFLFVLMALPFFSIAQENSPYSRYGIGNLMPSGNIASRSMGGIGAGFTDPTIINFLNPASYSSLTLTTFDVAADFASRTIKSNNPPATFTSKNAIISYLQIGFPLLNINKISKKNLSWGLNFGLRPISRINYKIESNTRNSIDSIQTTYEGSGGVNEAYVGTGIKISKGTGLQTKEYSFGINAGYAFGNKNYSTRLVFNNDTIPYLKSNSATITHFGGAFLQGGIQYRSFLKKGVVLIAGAYGKLQQTYNGSQDILRETFTYNTQTGNPSRLDSVYDKKDISGKVVMPASFGVGFTIVKEHFLYGADFEMTNWDNYRFYGQKDAVKNNWMLKTGFQFNPRTTSSRKYWDFVKYRAGVYLGPDYIVADHNLPQYGVTLGGEFPLKRKITSYYETQYSIMNIALDYGTRGNTTNSIRENIFHVSLGFTLSDSWFVRRKYQ